MKCKWYAEFEGVCTNGECPYRGDVCPTSEHMKACKYSENKYEVSELVKILRCCSNIGYICEECPANLDGEDCDGRLAKLQAAEGGRTMSTTEERTLKWLNDNIDFFTRYRAEPINANRTAFYDKMIEQQRVLSQPLKLAVNLKKHYLTRKM